MNLAVQCLFPSNNAAFFLLWIKSLFLLVLNIDSSWVDFNKDLICIRIKDMALSFLKLEFVFEVFFSCSFFVAENGFF